MAGLISDPSAQGARDVPCCATRDRSSLKVCAPFCAQSAGARWGSSVRVADEPQWTTSRGELQGPWRACLALAAAIHCGNLFVTRLRIFQHERQSSWLCR